MARTTVADVTETIDTVLGPGVVSSYVTDANLWVTEELVGEGLSDGRLEMIEKYLACHLVTLQDPRLKQGGADDVSETYQRDSKVTEYLKSAIAMDPTGKVQSAFMPREGAFGASFRVGDGFSD